MPKKRINLIKKEFELLMPFIKESWKSFTFKDIKRLSKKTSESYVYDGLKKYVNEEILVEEKVGNSIIYTLKLSNPKTKIYSGFIAEHIAWNNFQLPFGVIKKILSKIPSKYFTLIITGSYSRNLQKANSDLDIVIICDNSQSPKKIMAQIYSTCELSIPQGHPYIFTSSEFLEMLTNNEANYGKEIAKNNLILCGAEQYFGIMQEAISNGFNDKKLSGESTK